MNHLVNITVQDSCVTFTGPDYLLRRIIFHVQDMVWRDWFENTPGRSKVLNYVKTAADANKISIYRGSFLTDERLKKVKERLHADETPYQILSPETQAMQAETFGYNPVEPN